MSNAQLGIGKIVVVDDDDMERDIFSRVLKQSKLENQLHGLPSGKACLQYLELVATGQEPMPALVLVDIRMPGMDGFELVQTIRSMPQFKDLPIIAMFSNSDAQSDQEKAIQVGANAFHVKPDGIPAYIEFLNSLKLS